MKGKGYGLKNRTRIKGIVGFALILIALAGLFLWESVGREALLYQSVIVMKQDVEPNKAVSIEMLGKMKVPRDTIIGSVVLAPQEILGKETNSYIPAGLQLSLKFFKDPELTIGNGKYILALPQDWIYSFPQTIRRGDEIYFYPFSEEKESIYYDANGAPSYLPNDTVKSTPEGKPGNTALFGTKVAYVKDSSNCEVVDVKADRIDGSSPVSKIEVIITDEQYQKLKNAYEAGYQFVIMYE